MDLLKQYAPMIVTVICGLLLMTPDSARKWLVDLILRRKSPTTDDSIDLPMPEPEPDRDLLMSLCEIRDAALDAGDEELAKGLESHMVAVSKLEEARR